MKQIQELPIGTILLCVATLAGIVSFIFLAHFIRAAIFVHRHDKKLSPEDRTARYNRLQNEIDETVDSIRKSYTPPLPDYGERQYEPEEINYPIITETVEKDFSSEQALKNALREAKEREGTQRPKETVLKPERKKSGRKKGKVVDMLKTITPVDGVEYGNSGVYWLVRDRGYFYSYEPELFPIGRKLPMAVTGRPDTKIDIEVTALSTSPTEGLSKVLFTVVENG